MNRGVWFKNFALVEREVITTSPLVVRLRFALPSPSAFLGFEQPTTHIKVPVAYQ